MNLIPRRIRGRDSVVLAITATVLATVAPWSVQDVPECPLPTVTVDKERSPVRYSSEVPTAGRIADIPEFHDCQRLVEGTTYKAVTAVYARYRLDTIWETLVSLDSIALAAGKLRELIGRDSNLAIPVRTLSARFRQIVRELPGTALPSGDFRDSQVQAQIVTVLSTRRALLAASVRGWDGPYPVLGIGSGWNCLYLSDGDKPEPSAVMVQHGSVDNTCAPLVPADTTGIGNTVTHLMVRRVVAPRTRPQDYPPVARWEWDDAASRQYIGIMCDAWCEVSAASNHDGTPATLTSARSYEAATDNGPFQPDVSPSLSRTAAVKGWFDEEPLAPDPALAGQAPTTTRGTIFPDEHLGDYQIATAFAPGRWRPVARVSLSVANASYEGKFGFQSDHSMQRPLDQRLLTMVEFCRGSGCVSGDNLSCPSWPPSEPVPPLAQRWWAKFSRTDGRGAPVYKCVVRRGHEMVQHDDGTPIEVPGTARWRWMKDDQTIWARCDLGCCEVIR